jgi:hypothetical protein
MGEHRIAPCALKRRFGSIGTRERHLLDRGTDQ